MSNYIKSEFYRILRRRGTYMFIGVCSLLLVSANVVLALVKLSAPDFGYATTNFSLANLYSSMAAAFLLCVWVASMIFGNAYNNHTFKNSISYGISRGTLYFGKLIVQIVYALAAFIVISGLYILSAYLLLENSGPAALEMLFKTLFACLPFLIFALVTANCFNFILESTGASITATLMVLLAFPLVSEFLGMKFVFFEKLAKLLPWNLIGAIRIDTEKNILHFYWNTQLDYGFCWLTGIVQVVLFALIGYMIYRRKEIK